MMMIMMAVMMMMMIANILFKLERQAAASVAAGLPIALSSPLRRAIKLAC